MCCTRVRSFRIACGVHVLAILKLNDCRHWSSANQPWRISLLAVHEKHSRMQAAWAPQSYSPTLFYLSRSLTGREHGSCNFTPKPFSCMALMVFVSPWFRTLADMNKDGKMDRLEFSIAMKLIKMKLQGQNLPSALPIIMKQPPVPAPTMPLAPLGKLPMYSWVIILVWTKMHFLFIAILCLLGTENFYVAHILRFCMQLDLTA